MSPVTEPDLDAEYRQVREECGLIDRPDRSWIRIDGPDAAEFLQGQVTNETEELDVGSGAYAALLDRKGHLQADMRVLRLGEDSFLVDTEQATGQILFKHLTMYKIGRKVEVEQTDRALLSLVGPGSYGVTGLAPGPEHAFTEAVIAGADCLVATTVFGLDVICEPEKADAVRAQLVSDRAVPVSGAATEILRVERGLPRFGFDMTEANMPAEAGIVERAVSFTKGCYIGQEPVARLHYKGRPNRHLRGLKSQGQLVSGARVSFKEKEVGTIGTTVLSPASGRIALAILRKEAEPGSTVIVDSESGEVEAEVVELPFIGDIDA
ncbi:MAG TPA: glycine cleavage T C-terminal barrel domain-containing protein [Solirubrobacterales bacterium]|nr:glycine cleavage T C-terminal barrel domain-containing protein [Solirubrobacterales bacterium]